MVQQPDIMTRMSQAAENGTDLSAVTDQTPIATPAEQAPDDETTDWKVEAESLKKQLAEVQSKSKKLETDAKSRQGRVRKQSQDDAARLALEGKVDGITTTMDAILTALTSENTEGLQDHVAQAKQTQVETQARQQAQAKLRLLEEARAEALAGEDGTPVLDWDTAAELSGARMAWENALQTGSVEGLYVAVSTAASVARTAEINMVRTNTAQAEVEAEQQAEQTTREANPASLGVAKTSGGGSMSDREFAKKMADPEYSPTQAEFDRAFEINTRRMRGQL